MWTRADHAEPISTYNTVFVQDPFPLSRIDDPRATAEPRTVWFYIAIYMALSGLLVVLGTFKHLIAYIASVRASRRMFYNAIDTVLAMPLRWFDTTPVGRILSRFTTDFSILDSKIVDDFAETLYSFLELVGISVVGFIVTPAMIIFACVALAVAALVGKRYLGGAREVKRLGAIARSPIMELLDQVESGLVTIRAFARATDFVDAYVAQDAPWPTW